MSGEAPLPVMSSAAPPLVMDLQGRQLQEDELERFAEELFKYEELMKPPHLINPLLKSSEKMRPRNKALKQMGASFNIGDTREMDRQLRRFRSLCISKMRWLVRVSQERYGAGADALHIAPAWLRRLALSQNLMINALKMEQQFAGPQTELGLRMARFQWELYCSVRAALATGGDACTLLTDSRAVEPFALKAGLPLDTVHGIWTRMCAAALDELRAHSSGGDLPRPPHPAARAPPLPRAARPSPLDWLVIDLVLLHDTKQTTLAKDSFSNPMEVEAMLQLYRLIIEAYNRAGAGNTPNVTDNSQTTAGMTHNERTRTTYPTNTGTMANTVTRQEPAPSCSGASASASASAGTERLAQKYPLLLSQLQAGPVWESAEIWTMVHSEYNKRGRSASLVTLQRRWYELRLLARRDLLLSFRDQQQKPHPLLLAIVKRFPHVVTSPLELWPRLVRERLIHTHELSAENGGDNAFQLSAQAPPGATLTDLPSTVSMSDVMTDLLDWSDDEPEIIEPDNEVIEIDSDNEEDASADNTKQNEQNPRLKAIKTEPKVDEHPKIPQEHTKTTEDIVKTKETGNSSEKTANIMKSKQSNDLDTSLIEDLAKKIQTLQRNISLTGLSTCVVKSENNSSDSTNQGTAKTTDSPEATGKSNSQPGKINIRFEDEDYLNEIDNFDANPDDDSINCDLLKSEKQSPSENKSESDPKVKSENHSSSNEHMDKQNKSSNSKDRASRLSLKRKLIDNYYKKVPRDCFKDVVSRETNPNDKVSGNSETSVSSEVDSDSDSDSEDSSARNTVDEKLLMLSLVVLTPLEQLPDWQPKRDGSLRCRDVSVNRLAAPVTVTARQLNACRRYVPVREERQPPAYQPDAQPAAGASGTGITRAKREEMRNIPRAYKVVKRQLTRRLRLPRTDLSRAFWASARNVAQLCVCKPLAVALHRLAPRPVKKVELADLCEVRARNRGLLTAQVAPITVDQESAPAAEPDPDRAADGGLGVVESEAEADALPSQEDLMKMIKTLVHPSIQAMREADATQRLQREHDSDAHAAREAARLRSLRDTSQHLHNDIEHLINSYDVPEKPRKPAKRKLRVINEDDIPLPDAFQEWERQKTLIHKYFSFNNLTSKPDAKTQSKKPGPKNRTTNSVSKVNHSSNNKIDLMTVSDDERAVSRNRVSLTDDKSINNAKRPREDSDNANKRSKITEDQANDTSAKTNEDNTNTDSDDDGDRMIIDEGIRDIDDPLPTPNTQQVQPNDPRLTIAPINSVPGLHSDHDMPSNLVYVVKTHKKVNVPKSAEVIPTSSTVNSNKLPGDASLTLNTSVTTSINKKLPTYFFIGSGKQVKGDSEFKVVSGPSLQMILPKTTPASSQKSAFKAVSVPYLRKILPKPTPALSQNVTNTSESTQMLAQPKFTYPTNIIRMTGPLSAKYRIGAEISKALLGQKVKLNPEGTSDEILQPKIVEEIDLTDEPEVDDATGPKIVSITSLKHIKNENIVANPSTDSNDNSNKDGNIYDDLVSATKLPKASAGKPQTQNLEVGPVKSSINKRVYSNMRILTVTPENNDNKNQSSVNLTFTLNRSSPSNKSKDVAQTLCLDSEVSDENEILDCTSIKRERDVDVDASSNDSESRDVDIESEVPSASYADIHEANSSQVQTTGSKTTSQNKNTSKSILKPIAQNENSSRSRLKKTSQNQDSSRSLLRKTSQNVETSKGLPKTTSQNLETSNNPLEATPQNQEPNATPQTKHTDNIPIKITNTTTSKDLLQLSPEELARLLEDDNDEVIEYAPVPQKKVITQNIAPIQIKKEKQWAEEIQLSKEKEMNTRGVVVKQEPGSEEAPLELLLQGVPSVSELKTALPDVICGDVDPNDDEEAPYFESISDLGKHQINIKEYVAKVTDPEEPILKLDFSEPIWILAGKYLLLTDENIPYSSPSYLTSSKSGDVAPYSEIRFRDNVRNKQVLNLGTKKGRDVMVCGCAGAGQCMLCQSIAGEGGKAPEFEIYKPTFSKLCRACGVDPKRERARIYTIKQRPYRKIGDKPLKYVMLDVRRKCKVCKDDAQFVARPDTLVINDKYYEKMRDEPLMYAPVLSAVQSAASCASLARRGAELYALNARTACRRRVLYRADATFASLNAAVRAVIAKLDRDEVDARYRSRIDREQGR